MSYLRVDNFERYQNADIFKKSGGRPPWVKFYRDLLLDDDLLELSYPAQLLFDRLLLVAAGCRNAMSSDPEWLARRTGIDAATISAEIPKLVQGGWLKQTRSRRRSRNIREQGEKDSPPRTEQNRNKTFLVEGKNGAAFGCHHPLCSLEFKTEHRLLEHLYNVHDEGAPT
jgi:hypothetical protein